MRVTRAATSIARRFHVGYIIELGGKKKTLKNPFRAKSYVPPTWLRTIIIIITIHINECEYCYNCGSLNDYGHIICTYMRSNIMVETNADKRIEIIIRPDEKLDVRLKIIRDVNYLLSP